MTEIIALQLYTVRDETAKDFKRTLYRAAEIGYAGVEFAGYGDLPSKEMATLLAGSGLRAIGTHVGLAALEADFEREINYCLDIGCTFLVLPWLAQEWRNAEGFKRLAERLNEFGQRSQERGVTIGYHNHDFEFQQEGAKTLLEQLVTATDPALVKLELDTYWAAFAHNDPVAFIRNHPGRIASLHLKDMTAERAFTGVGYGTLNIASYVEAARREGIQIFIVENDKSTLPSLESARRSFEYVQQILK